MRKAPEGSLELGAGFHSFYEGIEADVPGSPVSDVIAGGEWIQENVGARCEMCVTNSGSVGLPIFEIHLKFLLTSERVFEKVFVQSWTMSGRTGISDIEEDGHSSGVMGWSDRNGTCAVVAGFLDHSKAVTKLKAVRISPDTLRVTATICRESIILEPGSMIDISPFWICGGESLSGLLESYAGEVSATMGRRPGKPAESGWCSWYHYYGKETFCDVASCAEELAGLPLSESLRTIQIDDGWNREPSGNLPDGWGDWEAHPEKFPEGMAAAARRIHETGFRAGLWLAPFAVSRKSLLFVEHADWLVQQRNQETGELSPAPTDSPEIFQLDCTHPEALVWLRETFHRVFSEWKFDYIKIDFLHYGAREGGIRYDSSATSIEAYRRGLAAINEAADDEKFILACGAPLLASVGLVDGMRVGPDVGGRWLFDPGWPDWPVGNCSVRSAAVASIWSQWMHGHLWQNDPDCIIVRSVTTRYESDALGRFEKDTALKNPNYLATPLGLTDEEAGLLPRLVWLSGGMALLSDVWSDLPADRQDLIAKCFPVHGRKVVVLDWFESQDIVALVAEGAPFLAGIFNFGDASSRPAVFARKLGLSGQWHLRERWSGEVFQGEGDLVVFPELPPHAGRVWEVSL